MPVTGIARTVVTGIGFLSDAYDLFVLNLVKELIAKDYPSSGPDAAAARDGALASAALIGAVLGQLVFGALADQMGRRIVFVLTLACVVAGSLLSAFCMDVPVLGGIYTQLIVCRFLLGVGVGGEYPLSATVASESPGGSSKAVSMVFAMQGAGNLLAAGLTWMMLALGLPNWLAWRLLLGLGGLPGLVTLRWRWAMEESQAFQAVVSTTLATSIPPLPTDGDPTRAYEEDEEDCSVTVPAGLSAPAGSQLSLVAGGIVAVASDTEAAEDFRQERSLFIGAANAGLCGNATAPLPAGERCSRTFRSVWALRWTLAGTAGAWFLFDVAFYAVGLFSGRVLEASGVANADRMVDVAAAQVGVAVMAIPGYIVAVYTLERIGTAQQQVLGFALCAVWFLGLAACWVQLEAIAPAAFVMAYGACFFFMNWGPNMTTYVLPTSVFPTEAKATCHGLSAAAGKMGAAVGAAALPMLMAAVGEGDGGSSRGSSANGLTVTLAACGMVLAAGAAWTQWTLQHLF